jgi:tetratricopeptide (TPR) repeat protein
VDTLTRRGAGLPRAVFDGVIREHLAAQRNIQTALRDWVGTVAPDVDAVCAIVGPDWATPALLDLLHAQNRMVAGVFTAVAADERTWRWGHCLRPLNELVHAGATHVLAGANARLSDRLRDIGCSAAVHVACATDDEALSAPDAELDALRRAQARDLAAGQITAVHGRLPLLSLLDGERGWAHKYDAAQAYERAKRPANALELFREVMSNCTSDPALALRAAFHTARLLIERGATQQASPLLAKILKQNPGHREARRMLEEITAPVVPAGVAR